MDVKIIAFLSFILVSLILSVWLEVKMQRKTNNILATISIAFNMNLLVLGSACIWWLLNAGEGISVLLGVQYFMASFLAIFFINILVMIFIRNRAVTKV